MHEDQVEVAVGTVRELVAEQFPAWAGLDVREVRSAATDNAIFRIGDGLAARLPLRRGDPDRLHTGLEAEAAAARELALVSPVPVALGEPRHGYPSPWSVQTWLPGHDATVEDPADPPPSPRTWPRSSPVSGPRTREDDGSVAAAGVAT